MKDRTNAERQKRWRKKNRALYNLRRRNARKDLAEERSSVPDRGVTSDTSRVNPVHRHVDARGLPSFQSEVKMIDGHQVRMITLPKCESEHVKETPVMPKIPRDDFGNVLTPKQWEKLQELKRRAKEGGYTIDEYSQ